MTALRQAAVIRSRRSRIAVVAGGGLVAFGLLLTTVATRPSPLGVDLSLLHLLRRHRSAALTSFAKAVSTLGSPAVVEVVVALTVLLLAVRLRSWLPILLGVICPLGAQTCSSGLKHLLGRPRPATVDWVAHVSAHGMAFPSGHATAAAAGFTLLAVLLTRQAGKAALRAATVTLATLLVVAVGWSRLYLGVHWPTDVIGGWLLGLGWTFTVVAVVDALGERHRADAQADTPSGGEMTPAPRTAPPEVSGGHNP